MVSIVTQCGHYSAWDQLMLHFQSWRRSSSNASLALPGSVVSTAFMFLRIFDSSTFQPLPAVQLQLIYAYTFSFMRTDF